MAKFKGVEKNCLVCGTKFKVPSCRAETAVCCSRECSVVYRAERQKKRVLLNCEHCNGLFEVPECHANRRTFCSRKCRSNSEADKARQSARVSGKNNPMWKGGVVNHKDGYLYQRDNKHPFASNGYVLQHRLVMEEWLRENDPESPFMVSLNGSLYLSPDYIVHHKDENKSNNQITNLECMTNGDHIIHHHDTKVEAVCNNCGSKYRVKRCLAGKSKYCSKPCHHAGSVGVPKPRKVSNQ